MEEIDQIFCKIKILEAEVKRLKSVTMIETMRGLSKNYPEKEVINTLYWKYPTIGTTKIIEALNLNLSPVAFRKLADPAIIETKCIECDRPIYNKFTTREELHRFQMDLKRPPKKLIWVERMCSKCNEAKYAQSTQGRQYSIKEQEARIKILREMPYKEYLLSPEWQKTRKAKLKSAYYRCNVCNTNKTELHVHHRTYARRAFEFMKDLIVLCKDCHKLFHDQGKLATCAKT